MSIKQFTIRRIPLWAKRSLLAIGLTTGIMVWSVRQGHVVDELDLTQSPRNLALALPRPAVDDWPGEWGLDGTGRSGLDRLPRQLGYGAQPSWRISLPGTAHGLPCAWGELAVVPIVDADEGRIGLVAVNRGSGQLVWQTALRRNLKINAAKLLSNATPACDGQTIFIAAVIEERLVVFATDLHGRLRWERDVGPMQAESGRLISPLLHKNLLIISGEHRGMVWSAGASTAHLSAVHRLTGDIIWRVRRPNQDSLAKPVIADLAGRKQLIIPAPGEIAAYDPDDGTLIWTCRWPARRTANSIAWNNHRIFVTTRDPQPTLMAIRADGSGDVTATHVLWQSSAAGSSLLNLKYFADSVICLQENGQLISVEASSGKVQWRKQLPGMFSAQSLLAQGELYCFGTGGRAILIDLTQRGMTLAESTLGADIIGSPVATRRQLLLRTASGLVSLPPEDGESPLVNSPPGTTNRL